MDRSEDFARSLTAINLHRIWWIIFITTLVNLAILGFNLLSPILHDYPLAAWQGVDALVSVALLVWISRLMKAPPRWGGALVLAFTALVFAFMDVYHFLLLRLYAHTAVYVLGVVSMGVLLLLPPARFLTVLLLNHALFCILLLASGRPQAVVLHGILEGSSAVVVAAMAGWFLYRARRNDFSQQLIIAERNRELELRNEEMSDVMAITAHDLRSPLHGVKHLLDFAAPLGGSERMVSALRSASQSCGEMLALIGRLLDAYAAGQSPAACELFLIDLRVPLAQAADRAQAQATAKGIAIDLRLPEVPREARVAPAELSQVLDNLVANAVKFSPSGGKVSLALDAENGAISIEVSDEGPGVPESERIAIFQKFHRGQHAESGAGLGLFIVRQFMESMKGTVRHIPKPAGSIFRLEFPAGKSS